MTDIRIAPPPSSAPRVAGPDNFECALSRSGRDAVWIRLAGELDLAAAPLLEQTLSEPLGGERLIVLDLRDLTFMDSTGLHIIIDSDNRARRSGSRLVLVRGPAQIERLFELVGLSERLEIVDPEPVGPHPAPVAGPMAAHV